MSTAANILVLVVAVFLGILVSLVRDKPISLKDPDLVKFGDPRYDIADIDTPIATGWQLNALSYLFTQSPIGFIVRRALLNKNGFYKLRELSAQISSTPPLHHPIRRVSTQESYSSKTNSDSLYEQFVKEMDARGEDESAVFNSNFPRRTVRYYHQQYKSGVKPSDVMRNTLERIEEWREEHKLNIFAKILIEQVMEAARESDARYAAGNPLSLLDGVPIAIKDMIHVRDHTSYNGKSPLKEHRAGHYEPTADDIMVRRMREAGAIIIGTTIMTEGGVTPLGWSAHFQGPFNVYNFDRYCGGSSSGSAVAVASGLVPVAIGFDGGGSIRIPASMSGIQGLGTTFGRLPFDVGLETTMIKGGPMSSTTEDAALVYSVIAENEKGHFYNHLYDGDVNGPPSPSLEGYYDTEDLSDIRIGFWKEWFEDADPEVVSACYAALHYLEAKGATIVPIEIPHLRYMSLAHASKITTEFAIKFDHMLHTTPEALEPNTKITIGVGSTMTALEVLAGERLRAWGFDYVNEMMASQNLSCIINPTIGVLPPHLSDEARLYGENNNPLTIQLMKYIFLGNFLGLPGWSVNVGYGSPPEGQGSRSPVPIGLHFLGQHWGEQHLFRLAHVLEMWEDNDLLLPSVFHDPFQL